MRYALPLAALLAAAIALPAASQEPAMPKEAPGKPDAARAVAGSYKLDPAHSQVVFTVTHFGFSEYSGQFRQPTGTMTLDPKNISAAKVDVTFPIAKVSTTVEALDKHLVSADFFDAAKFPQGHFVSTGVTANGLNATITGNLTLHGVTKPVVLKARLVGAGLNPFTKKQGIGFAATTSVNRSDFGMTTGIPLVSDRVDLVINAAFDAQ